MKLAYRDFPCVIETSADTVTGIVIENQNMLYRFLVDLMETLDGSSEKVVLSQDNAILDFAKSAELLTDFIRFDLNEKALLSKIVASIDKIAASDRFYDSSQQLLMNIESYMLNMTLDFPCSLTYDKLNMQSIIKAMGISIVDDSSCLAEKILSYMELVRDFLNKKLFIFVNLRGFIPFCDLQRMIDTALLREHEIILIDYVEYPKLNRENRLIVDEDLCEI